MQEQEISFPTAPRKRKYTAAQRAAILRARKKRKAERRRNQLIFLSLCVVVLVLLVVGIVKLALLAVSAVKAIEFPDFGQVVTSMLTSASQAQSESEQELETDTQIYGDVSYDVSDYVFDASDERLILVNTNLPLDENYLPQTAVADDATGATLETEAAASYRAMASAAALDGITLVLSAGYYDVAQQQAVFDEWQQYYLDGGYTQDEAYAFAQSIVGAPCASEHQTGYGADILSSDYTTADTGFADSTAFAWLERYAAEYGFVLRYPEDKQMITGRVYEPWHWRYVGVENAKAMVESGLCLEEFIALEGAVS